VRRVRGALLVSVVLAAGGLGGVLWVGRAPVPTEPPPAAGPAEALSATSYAPAVSAPSW